MLIAAIYFGGNLHAQSTQDTAAAENKIEEVVVIGYGSQKKENVTGSIGIVSAKDLADKPNANPLSSVQGRLAGVNVVNSGTPGGSPRVDIRGIGSLSGNTVFIVDGMLTEDISFLNPQDIESMSVLKDPSSLAIFGAKAANGAVIIKTKTGKGKPVFNLNSYLGIKTVTNVPKMVNGDQYIELYNERLINDNKGSTAGSITKAGYPGNTDWFKEILRTSMINSNDFSASGSLGKLNYYGSVGYLQDEGNLAAGRGINSGSGFNRFNTKLNLSYKVTDNITIGNNFAFSKMRTDIAQNPLLDARNAPPVFGTINPDTGMYQYITLVTVPNPRAKLDLYRSQERQERLLNNVWAEVKFLKDFTFRSSYTSDNYSPSKYEYTPTLFFAPTADQRDPLLITRDVRHRNYVWDNTINWKKSFGSHNLDLLAGFSRIRDSRSEDYWSANNVMYDGTNGSLNIQNGTDIVHFANTQTVPVAVTQDQQRIESFFGRINYDYAGKYLLNASIRRDATSQISVDRAKVFPAVSIGWVASKEGFMSNQTVFDLLKFRAGWFKFKDMDGNGVIDSRDKTFLGSPIPKGTYGFGFNLNIHAIDFGIDFQGVFGNKIYNYNREQRYGNESWDLDMYNNRWTGAGTSNTNSMITSNQLIIAPNSFYVEDGSYFRIRNIQVGYSLPKNIANSLSVNKLRIYLSAQNPWTSFKYNGFSPEIMNTDRVQMGIDQNIYPISAIYTMGMNLTF